MIWKAVLIESKSSDAIHNTKALYILQITISLRKCNMWFTCTFSFTCSLYATYTNIVIRFVENPFQEHCCTVPGLYNYTQFSILGLDAKLKHALSAKFFTLNLKSHWDPTENIGNQEITQVSTKQIEEERRTGQQRCMEKMRRLKQKRLSRLRVTERQGNRVMDHTKTGKAITNNMDPTNKQP